MKKLVLISVVLAFFAPTGINAQSAAADKAWTPFFTKFKAAVKARSKPRVKALMGPERTWFDGGGGDTRDQWLNSISKQNLWNEMLSGLNQGVKSCGRGCKTTLERGPVFEFKNGRWLFIQIMGD